MSKVSMCTSYSKSTPFSSCYKFLRNPIQLTSKDLDDVATVNQESCNSVHLFPAVLWKCVYANAEFFDFERHVAAAFSDGLAAETTSRGSDLEDLRQREMAGLRY